jgi:hypothetical protein
MTMMFEAEKDSALECEQIFNQFGTASGLKVNWSKTAAVLIRAEQIQEDFSQFQWKWENTGDYSKLLGFPFGEGISDEMVLKQMQHKIAEQIQLDKTIPYERLERVVVVNELLMGAGWYRLTLWKGDIKELNIWSSLW